MKEPSARTVRIAALMFAGEMARRAEEEMQAATDRMTSAAEEADEARRAVHFWADVVEQGARELAQMDDENGKEREVA